MKDEKVPRRGLSGSVVPPEPDSFFRAANYTEAGLWILVGLVFACYAVRRGGTTRRQSVAAAAAFGLFGGSDIVEAATGAWWRPWWLFVWKALCVVALLALLSEHWRQGRKRA